MGALIGGDAQLLGLGLADWLHRGLTLLVVVACALIAQHLVVRVTRKALEAANVPSASILINICRALIWSFALLMVLQPVFGIEPTAFVAALGVTSVALSLGLQDTISNIIGGLALMTGKVIQPGDVVTIGSVTGRVTDINWRSTVVEQRTGDVHIIPNSVLSKTALTKLSPAQATACELPITIRPGSDVAEVRVDAEIAARKALGTLYDEDQGIVLLIRGFDAFGTQATLTIHVLPGLAFADARAAVAERLVDAPWLMTPCDEGLCVPGVRERPQGGDQGAARRGNQG